MFNNTNKGNLNFLLIHNNILQKIIMLDPTINNISPASCYSMAGTKKREPIMKHRVAKSMTILSEYGNLFLTSKYKTIASVEKNIIDPTTKHSPPTY